MAALKLAKSAARADLLASGGQPRGEWALAGRNWMLETHHVEESCPATKVLFDECFAAPRVRTVSKPGEAYVKRWTRISELLLSVTLFSASTRVPFTTPPFKWTTAKRAASPTEPSNPPNGAPFT